MASVGIRELKACLSRYIGRAKQGERITVTERGRPVAIIGPPAVSQDDQRIEAMVRDGTIRWWGGKPRGARRLARLKGPTVAAAVLEDRE